MVYNQFGVEELFNAAIKLAADDYQKLYQGFVKSYGHEPSIEEFESLNTLEKGGRDKSPRDSIFTNFRYFLLEKRAEILSNEETNFRELFAQYKKWTLDRSIRIEGRLLAPSTIYTRYAYGMTEFKEKLIPFFDEMEDYKLIHYTQKGISKRHFYSNECTLRKPNRLCFEELSHEPATQILTLEQIRMRSDYYKLKTLEDFFHGPKYRSWTSIDGDYILRLCRKGIVAKSSQTRLYPNDSNQWTQDEYLH